MILHNQSNDYGELREWMGRSLPLILEMIATFPRLKINFNRLLSLNDKTFLNFPTLCALIAVTGELKNFNKKFIMIFPWTKVMLTFSEKLGSNAGQARFN